MCHVSSPNFDYVFEFSIVKDELLVTGKANELSAGGIGALLNKVNDPALVVYTIPVGLALQIPSYSRHQYSSNCRIDSISFGKFVY